TFSLRPANGTVNYLKRVAFTSWRPVGDDGRSPNPGSTWMPLKPSEGVHFDSWKELLAWLPKASESQLLTVFVWASEIKNVPAIEARRRAQPRKDAFEFWVQRPREPLTRFLVAGIIAATPTWPRMWFRKCSSKCIGGRSSSIRSVRSGAGCTG